jgi:hypothetical protein
VTPVTAVFLTQGIDTPNSGFASDANGTPLVPPGFTATVANTLFNALPFVTPLGLANNTLNTIWRPPGRPPVPPR